MKKILILLFTLFLLSCDEKVKVITQEEKNALELKAKLEQQIFLESQYDIIILDSCEYYVRSLFREGYMSHKGNCKNH